MRLPAGTRLGDYEILSLLGAGGMGEVYRARDLKLRREVAVKVLSTMLSGDEDAVARFRREAEAASALNHPHIVTVHGFGEGELPGGSRCSYMVVELISGRTIRSLMHDSSVPRSELLRYLAQAAEGLAKAHAAGIVHRDLKPENIMVSDDGFAKILDFGLAKLHAPVEMASADAPTQRVDVPTNAVIGTAGYISPEQVRGRSADARSDIFAFGCILYEVATGRSAFTGESPFDVLSNVVHEEPEPLGDEVPEPLARIIRRCLAKNPEQRYQSARDLAADLHDARTPVTTRVPRPRRTPRATLFVLLAALAVAAIAGWLLMRRTRVAAHPFTSLVVLPFGNTKAEDEYLSDGVTDALLADLSRAPNLRVIARTTAFRYKKTKLDVPSIARELGVDGVVAGQVSRGRGGLVVNAELIDAADGTRIWGARYESSANDMLVVEREIAGAIGEALRIRRGAVPKEAVRAGTESGAAYDLYLKGRYFWNKRNADSVTKALALFNEAIEADPTYARAYSGVADCYIARLQLGAAPSQQSCDRGVAAARQALELDPSIAEAHTSMGYLHLCCRLDLDAAAAEFTKAIELNPNYAVAHHWFGVYLVNAGDTRRGVTEMRAAAERDPFSTQIQSNLAFAYVHAGDRARAEKMVADAIELDPNATYPYHMRGYVALAAGDTPHAIEYLKEASAKGFAASLPFLAYAYAKSGDAAAARATMAEIDRQPNDFPRTPALRAGTVYLLGDRDEAFRLLERAYERHDYWLSALRISPPFEPLRADPRYAAFERRVYGAR